MPILAIGLFLDCILFLYVSPETANITKFISKSSSPSYAVEGKKITLEWNYILDGTVRSAQYVIINPFLSKRFPIDE